MMRSGASSKITAFPLLSVITSGKGAGVGAAIGAAGGALLGLFQKGQDVTLPKGTSIVVQLESDVRFVKPTSRTQGVRLDN